MATEREVERASGQFAFLRLSGRRVPSVTFAAAVASGLLLWASFPPLAIWPLAWVAPIFWIWLIRRAELDGQRPYRALYLAGCIHWLVMLQWIRLPHWTANFGWFALTGYLAIYLPLFIGLSRVAVHRFRVSAVFAAPAVWTGLELVRGYLFTGFSLELLGHTQVGWTQLIQIADLFGAYGVSFVVMLVAACVGRALPWEGRKWSWWPLPIAAVILGAALIYGQARIAWNVGTGDDLQIALVQGSIDTQFGVDRTDLDDSFAEYRDLSLAAIAGHSDLDLIVWPESMFASHYPLITYDEDLSPPAGAEISPEEYRQNVQDTLAAGRNHMKWVAQELGTSILAGTHAVHVGNGTISQFNSAILLDRSGQLVGRYDKMHPVMFGEYVPFGRWIPRLYRLSPLQGGLTAGREAVAFSVGGWKMAPSICFENTVPHLIRRQVAQLEAMGESPDLLVTITNDGWFWGSSLLDVHLTSAVFRAVETRRTMLVAANTGFSAWIDGNGQVLAKGPRRDTEVLIAKVHRDGRTSPYVAWGDWFAGLCFAFCLAAIAGISGKSVRSLSRIRNAVRTLVDQDHRTSGFSRP